ncbi:MAG: hypothetical protein QOG43_1326 [Actinomycetota bacterium]|nr:hypothetical protein [Actinomycetota bacterium]
MLYPLSYEGGRISIVPGRGGGSDAPGTIVGVGKLTVLVIDDDPVILELLRVNFEIEGFHVVTAKDGDEGFALAQKLQPDVVISDIMMPRRDGLQLLSDLKSDPSTETLPVILLSAKAQKSEVEHGLDMGADDYITKPFDPIQLIDRLNAVVGKSRR